MNGNYPIPCAIIQKNMLEFMTEDFSLIDIFIKLHFKLFNGVNVFIVELFLLYQTLTTGFAFDKVNF